MEVGRVIASICRSDINLPRDDCARSCFRKAPRVPRVPRTYVSDIVEMKEFAVAPKRSFNKINMSTLNMVV